MKLTARTITKERTQIFLGDDSLAMLNKQIHSHAISGNGIYILVDSQTKALCLPVLFDHVPSLSGFKVIEVEGGEHCKSLETAGILWQNIHQHGAGRNSLIINLGGGVVTDLGGFVAGGFQRGIRYFNVPTSLIGQADAAIGGKTAVNLGNIKNQVGFFYPPVGVFVFPGFLKTLPRNHLRSGLAEIIKSAILSDQKNWRKLLNHPVGNLLDEPSDGLLWKKLIVGAISYKVRLVVKDFKERNIRKALNFGHTIGHAFESYSMTDGHQPLLHGEAVAAGMICAVWLSCLKTGLVNNAMKEIRDYLVAGFNPVPFAREDIPKIMEIMKFDKKNDNGKFCFTLLSSIGSPRINVNCGPDEVTEALLYYLQELKPRES